MRAIVYLDEPLTSEAVKIALETAADVVAEGVLDSLRIRPWSWGSGASFAEQHNAGLRV